MAAELILHIGGFKTGSTSIQAALAKCNYTVPGKTILYPGVAEREGLAKSRGQHDRLARTPFPNQPVARHREARFAAVARRLRKSDADTDYAVLSAEMFEYVNPQLLAAEIDRHFPEYRDRLRIIGYVRPHAERLVSGYAERVKHGFFLGSLEEFHQASSVKDKPHHWGFFYAQRFARWKACFGDAFQIRPMIRDRLIAGALLPANWLMQAQRMRRRFRDAVARVFDDVWQTSGTPTCDTLACEIEQESQLLQLVLILDPNRHVDEVVGLPCQRVSVVKEERRIAFNCADTCCEDAGCVTRCHFQF